MEEPFLQNPNQDIENAFQAGEIMFSGFDTDLIERGDYSACRKILIIHISVALVFIFIMGLNAN